MSARHIAGRKSSGACRALSAVAALLFAATSSPAQSEQQAEPTAQSGSGEIFAFPSAVPGLLKSLGEATQNIPITNPAFSPDQPQTIYLIHMPDLQAGDVLMITASAEVRNTTNYNIEFTSVFTLSASLPGEPGWWPIEEGNILGDHVNGTNVSPQMHYFQPDKAFLFRVPRDMQKPFLAFRIRGRSTNAKSGDTALVMSEYGEMSVLIFRAAH